MLGAALLRKGAPFAFVLLVHVGAVAAATVSFCPGAPPFFCDSGPVGPNTDVVVPIRVDPTAGVDELSLLFQYDPAVLTPMAAFRSAATQAYDLTVDFDTPGTVALGLFGGPPLMSPIAENVAEVLFRVVGPVGSDSPLTWVEAVLNGGQLDGSTQDSQLQVAASDSILSLPDDAAADSGASVIVPLSASNASGAEGIDLTVRFDPTVVVATGVTKTPLTQSMSLTVNLTQPGEVRISLFTAGALNGSGALVNIEFDAVGGSTTATPLNLARGTINEGQISTVLDDGLLALCSIADLDEDGVTSCDGDCDDENENVFPGADELCDLADNDCNGLVDDLIAPAGIVALSLERIAGATLLSWTALAGADAYDVVSGGLTALQTARGDFASAMLECLADDQPNSSLADEDVPAPDDDDWFLVRPVNCGIPGSYESGGTEQVGDRDSAIDAAPLACP